MDTEILLMFLIANYELCLEEIKNKETTDEIIQFLNLEGIDKGICKCAAYNFCASIYGEKWVMKHVNNSCDCFPVPLRIFDLNNDYKLLLKLRIKKMKEILKTKDY